MQDLYCTTKNTEGIKFRKVDWRRRMKSCIRIYRNCGYLRRPKSVPGFEAMPASGVHTLLN